MCVNMIPELRKYKTCRTSAASCVYKRTEQSEIEQEQNETDLNCAQQSKTERNRAKTERNRAKQSTTEQNRAKQSKNRAKQSETEQKKAKQSETEHNLSLINISEPTRLRRTSYAVFCLKKKKKKKKKQNHTATIPP